MADKKAAPAKKKPVSKTQATSVASFLKQQKGGTEGGPAAPNANANNPVTTDDDDDESQGA